jgi:hypothetical protein
MAEAQSRPLTVEEVHACFEKTDGLPFHLQYENIKVNGDIFFAKSRLNAFRRAFFDALVESRQTHRERIERMPLERIQLSGQNEKIAVIATDFSSVTADIAVYKPDGFLESLPKNFTDGNFEKYLYYPAYLTGKDLEQYAELAKHVDGIYAENYGGVLFAKEHGLKLFAGTGFNLTNAVAVSTLLQNDCVSYYAISKELSVEEKKFWKGEKAFALSSGDLKVMDLCYCPFEKSCARCDKKKEYLLTDENARGFVARRFETTNGCRFELYNCASLIGEKTEGIGSLIDLTTIEDKATAIAIDGNVDKQKKFYQKYTFGHSKTNPFL